MSSPSGEKPNDPRGAHAGRPHVLILGGGFGGIGAARKLKKADVDVTLVDKHDYDTFQPLLYQVAGDLLETFACGHPLRDLFHEQPNVTAHSATVSAIDLDKRQVQVTDIAALSYDYLVLAVGALVNLSGVEGAGALAEVNRSRRPSRGFRRWRHRLDHRLEAQQGPSRLGSVALQAGEHAGENVARIVASEDTD